MIARYFRLHFQTLGAALGRIGSTPTGAALNVLVIAIALALPADGQNTAGCTWSPPVTVTYPGIPELQLNIPVTDEWVTRNIFAPAQAPLSNPIGASIPAHPPAGYRHVWDDGRINFKRGLPRT